jgi:hypothetical protein
MGVLAVNAPTNLVRKEPRTGLAIPNWCSQPDAQYGL